MDGVLRVISGPNVGACFVLGERTRLGRAVDADIQLPETHVSRHHARIVQLETDIDNTESGVAVPVPTM